MPSNNSKLQRMTSNSSTSSTTNALSYCYPTCAQPIDYNLVIVGCSDGSVQFWNIEENIIQKMKAQQQSQQASSPAVQAAAAILQIIPAVSISDLYDAEHKSSATNSHPTVEVEQEIDEKLSHYRFVTVASNGIGHVWTTQIKVSRSTTESIPGIHDNGTVSSSLSYLSSIHTVSINKPLA
jgi:hypothetical protein